MELQSENKIQQYLGERAIWNSKKTFAKISLSKMPLDCIPNFYAHATSADLLPNTNLEPIIKPNIKGLTCIACQLAFSDVKDQQLHFKSSLHCLNLKRKLKGFQAVGDEKLAPFENNNDFSIEEEDELMDEDSDSGAENKVTDEEYEVKSNVDLLTYTNDQGSVSKKFSSYGGPVFIFRDAQLPHWRFSISAGAFTNRSIFSTREWNQQNPWPKLQDYITDMKCNAKCAVFLLRSGRFSGAIFDAEQLLIHKVMRRYTVRAKAGGGQSSHDNKSGKARSAGAMLRRYGEQALKEDIHACLKLWSAHIQCCNLLLIAAPKTMRSILFEDNDNRSATVSNNGVASSQSGNTLLYKDDPRISYVPFPVGKPTLNEAKDVYERCTHIIFSKVTDDDDAAVSRASFDEVSNIEGRNNEYIQGRKIETQKSSSIVTTTPLEEEEEANQLLTCAASQQILELCSSNCCEKEVITLIQTIYAQCTDNDDKNNISDINSGSSSTSSITGGYTIDTIVNMSDSIEQLNTPLHLAAANGMAVVVAQLLLLGASPVAFDIRGRTAYYVSKDKDTRDAFRRYRAGCDAAFADNSNNSCSENAVDNEVAANHDKVVMKKQPRDASNSSSDMIYYYRQWDWVAAGVGAALSEEVEKAQKAKEKEKKKRAALRKKEEKRNEEAAVMAAKTALAVQQQQALIAKQQQLEQSKAEAGYCAACQTSLFQLAALDVFDRRCCSSECVVKLRRMLAADAALKRMGGR